MAQEFLNRPDVIVRLQQVGIGFHVVYVTTYRALLTSIAANAVPSIIIYRDEGRPLGTR
jgi:hypothetical protein